MPSIGFSCLNSYSAPLQYVDGKLTLSFGALQPQAVDFTKLKWHGQRKQLKREGLIRAIKPQANQSIIDATAGWGHDASILAAFGAKVLMLERHPIMHALLADGLIRYEKTNQTHQLRLIEHPTDAQPYLASLKVQAYPEVIYLDPMHPKRNKTALVKKDMQLLQGLKIIDSDASNLLSIARQCARKKVVVKWPLRAPPIQQPSYSIKTRLIRFDVFICSQPAL